MSQISQRNRVSTWFALSLRAFVASAVACGSFVAAHAQSNDDGRHVMWRVVSDSTVVYLLGSVHALPSDIYPLDDILERSFDSCARLALELDLSAVTMPGMQVALMSRGTYAGRDRLANHVSAETYKLLSDRLKREGMDVTLVNQFKPWVVGILVMSFELQRAGLKSELGLDLYFQRRADSAGIETVGLESVEDQLAVFEEMSPEIQEQFLVQQLSDDTTSVENLQRLVQAWRTGDTATLAATMADEMESPQLYDRMVVKRNRNWLGRIEEFLRRRDRSMIVVGALHLVGRDGLVQLLKLRGYTVEQL